MLPRLVTKKAPGTTGADEVQPRTAVLELDGGPAEWPPSAHHDPSEGDLEHGYEVPLDIRFHAERCAEGEELVRNRLVGAIPADREVAD